MADATVIDVIPPAAGSETEGFLDGEGNFIGNWKESLVDEEIRGERFFDSDYARNVKTLLKKAYHNEKLLGEYTSGKKKGVIIPGEKTALEDVQMFRDAFGVPKEYAYKRPDDIDEDVITSDFMKGTMERLNKVHVNQKQFDEIMDIFSNRIREFEKEGIEELSEKTKKAIERVEKEDPDGVRRDLAKRFITKVTDKWDVEKYQELFGKENENGERTGGINSPEYAPVRPLLLDLFATIEETYAIPSSAALADTVESKVTTIEDELKALEATPGFMEGRLRTSSNEDDRKKHQEIMKKRSELIRRQEELKNNIRR